MEKQYNKDGFIPKHGGYQQLITFQKAEIIYDGTHYFCHKYFQKYDRTIDLIGKRVFARRRSA